MNARADGRLRHIVGNLMPRLITCNNNRDRETFPAFCRLQILFQNELISKKSFRNTIRVSNSLDPDQARRSGSKLCAKVISRRHWEIKG